jgi:hypothetical protein
VANGPETTLQKGMPAATVRHIMGEPSEIRPMQAPVGKAETWVYHRTTRGPVKQIVVGTRSVPMTSVGSDAESTVMGKVEEPVIRQETLVVEETINLLMFNDHLIEQNKTVQTRMEYQ